MQFLFFIQIYKIFKSLHHVSRGGE